MQKIVLIGGSAGSLDVLMDLLPQLKASLPYPIILVLHRKASNDFILTDLLAAKTSMQVREAEEKDVPLPGYIYIVPGDYHLLFEKDHSFTLDYSERVNYSRPSIDVVFQSAAEVYGKRTVGIVLSGANADGTEGCQYIRQKGGIAIAQRPDSAEVPYMPENAIANMAVDRVLNVDEMAAYLNQLI